MTPPLDSSATVDSTDFKFSCPFCQQHLACDDNSRGREIQCPACKAEITVPGLLGLATHAASKDHAFGDYSPALRPGQAPKVGLKKV
jgi:hypothetical protein